MSKIGEFTNTEVEQTITENRTIWEIFLRKD